MILPVTAPVRSGFDPDRVHPLHGYVIPHTGVDFSVPVGTPVLAPLPWTFEATGYDPPRPKGQGAGRWLRLDHGLIDGHRIRSRYYHLSGLVAAPGPRGVAGQIVALSGNSGDSTGPHLHFEIRVDGTPVDPIAWLEQHTTAPTQLEDDMHAIRNHDGSIGLVKPDGTLEPVPSIGLWNVLLRCGAVAGYHQETDGTVWNALTAHTARVRAAAAGVDVADVAARVAALVVPAVVDAIAVDPTTPDLTETQVQAAARAVRSVLGSLDH